MTYNVFSGTLNPTQSISQSVRLSVRVSAICLSHAYVVTNPGNLLAIFLYHMKGKSC